MINYYKWIKSNPKPFYTVRVGSRGVPVERNCYEVLPGLIIYNHWVSPLNIFKNAHSYVVIDYLYRDNEYNKKLLEGYGGILDTGFGYHSENYGMPAFYQKVSDNVFDGVFGEKQVKEDADTNLYMKRAFDFINENILNNNSCNVQIIEEVKEMKIYNKFGSVLSYNEFISIQNKARGMYGEFNNVNAQVVLSYINSFEVTKIVKNENRVEVTFTKIFKKFYGSNGLVFYFDSKEKAERYAKIVLCINKQVWTPIKIKIC